MSSSAAEAHALALLQAGRHAEAEAAWRERVARAPGDARALHFLGLAIAGCGRADEALALVDRSLELEPRNAMFLANRARLLVDAGRIEDAAADLRRAVARDARFAPAWLHLGLLLERLGRGEEAIAALRRAASIDARAAGAHSALGRLLQASGDTAGARASLERALALLPGDADLLNNLGLALASEGRREEAVASFRESVERRPGFAAALLNWGNALKDAGDLEGAGLLYERALAARPDFVQAALNAASAALDRDDGDSARGLYERALAIDPGSADARYGLGLVALRERRFAAGWEGYEARFATAPPQATARLSVLPRLTAADLGGGRRVAVWSEQGLGDQLLFATLLPELERLGHALVVEMDPRLHGMLKRAMPGIAWVAPSAPDSSFAACEAQVPLGSLPALLRRDAASFARQPAALLAPDAARVEAFRTALGPGRCIAIAWRSLQKGEREALARRKSIPLEAFAALARGSGERLVDLQYGEVGEERRAFDAAHPGVRFRLEGLDAWGDVEGVCAAIAACGRLVTASNVTAHLAGAIGASATVVCLGTPPFHYWVPGADGRSPWYPSVRVAADPRWSDWEEALASVAGEGS